MTPAAAATRPGPSGGGWAKVKPTHKEEGLRSKGSGYDTSDDEFDDEVDKNNRQPQSRRASYQVFQNMIQGQREVGGDSDDDDGGKSADTKSLTSVTGGPSTAPRATSTKPIAKGTGTKPGPSSDGWAKVKPKHKEEGLRVQSSGYESSDIESSPSPPPREKRRVSLDPSQLENEQKEKPHVLPTANGDQQQQYEDSFRLPEVQTHGQTHNSVSSAWNYKVVTDNGVRRSKAVEAPPAKRSGTIPGSSSVSPSTTTTATAKTTRRDSGGGGGNGRRASYQVFQKIVQGDGNDEDGDDGDEMKDNREEYKQEQVQHYHDSFRGPKRASSLDDSDDDEEEEEEKEETPLPPASVGFPTKRESGWNHPVWNDGRNTPNESTSRKSEFKKIKFLKPPDESNAGDNDTSNAAVDRREHARMKAQQGVSMRKSHPVTNQKRAATMDLVAHIDSVANDEDVAMSHIAKRKQAEEAEKEKKRHAVIEQEKKRQRERQAKEEEQRRIQEEEKQQERIAAKQEAEKKRIAETNRRQQRDREEVDQRQRAMDDSRMMELENRLKAEYDARKNLEAEARIVESKRLEEEKAAEQARMLEERRLAAEKVADEKRLVELEAKLKAEEEARKHLMEAALQNAQEEARIRAELEAKLKAEEEARIKAEEEAQKAAEEARIEGERRLADEREAERIWKAEEEARIAEEKQEAAAELRQAEEKRLAEEIRMKDLEERLRQEEEARKKLEEEAKAKAVEEKRIRAGLESKLKSEEEARIKAEEEAKIRAEEEVRLKAEFAARHKADGGDMKELTKSPGTLKKPKSLRKAKSKNAVQDTDNGANDDPDVSAKTPKNIKKKNKKKDSSALKSPILSPKGSKKSMAKIPGPDDVGTSSLAAATIGATSTSTVTATIDDDGKMLMLSPKSGKSGGKKSATKQDGDNTKSKNTGRKKKKRTNRNDGSKKIGDVDSKASTEPSDDGDMSLHDSDEEDKVDEEAVASGSSTLMESIDKEEAGFVTPPLSSNPEIDSDNQDEGSDEEMSGYIKGISNVESAKRSHEDDDVSIGEGSVADLMKMLPDRKPDEYDEHCESDGEMQNYLYADDGASGLPGPPPDLGDSISNLMTNLLPERKPIQTLDLSDVVPTPKSAIKKLVSMFPEREKNPIQIEVPDSPTKSPLTPPANPQPPSTADIPPAPPLEL